MRRFFLFVSLLVCLAVFAAGAESAEQVAVPTPTPTPTLTPALSAAPVPTASPTAEPTPTPVPTETPTPYVSPEPQANIRQTEGELNRVVDFTDDLKQQERAIRRILGSEEDLTYRDLHQITEIYFVGTMSPARLSGVEIAPDGTVTVNGPEVKEGSVASLDLIAAMPYLEKLVLIKQPLGNISALAGMTRLQEVNLACSAVAALPELTNMPSLRSLNLAHTAVTDLTPLRALPNLEEVTISTDMLPLTLDPEAAYDVVLIQ
jgi:Leucine-rich repeat (LRR) protein